jgi:ABC-2 type transport system permease protein
MTVFATLAEVTLRALLGRRRTILLILLAGIPVVVAILARIGGARLDDALPAILELGVRTVLPLTALVFGTSALGSEIEDGTAVFIMAKPIPRWQVAVAKASVAGLLAAVLNVASTLLTGALIGAGQPDAMATTFAFAVAVAVAAFGYAALFVALSVVTGRALIVGLIYTLVWEGILAGLLEGTRLFSVREATLTVAEALAPVGAQVHGDLDLATAVVILAAVLVGSLLLASSRLRAWEVRGSD